MKGASDEKFCEDFIRGYNDCKNGVPHSDQGKAHKRGYSTRYEEEQIASHIWKR
jgi:hypothetical protein